MEMAPTRAIRDRRYGVSHRPRRYLRQRRRLLAVNEINTAGGIDERKLKLIIEDSKRNARDSITAYAKLPL